MFLIEPKDSNTEGTGFDIKDTYYGPTVKFASSFQTHIHSPVSLERNVKYDKIFI